jgi:hypothetical protein
MCQMRYTMLIFLTEASKPTLGGRTRCGIQAEGGQTPSYHRITFRLYAKFSALVHTYSLVCLICSNYIPDKELVKSYLCSVSNSKFESTPKKG